MRKANKIRFLDAVGGGTIVRTMRNGIRQILRRDFGTQIEAHYADFACYEERATIVVMK